jgi:hypothetical protein
MKIIVVRLVDVYTERRRIGYAQPAMVSVPRGVRVQRAIHLCGHRKFDVSGAAVPGFTWTQSTVYGLHGYSRNQKLRFIAWTVKTNRIMCHCKTRPRKRSDGRRTARMNMVTTDAYCALPGRCEPVYPHCLSDQRLLLKLLRRRRHEHRNQSRHAIGVLAQFPGHRGYGDFQDGISAQGSKIVSSGILVIDPAIMLLKIDWSSPCRLPWKRPT